MAEEKVRWDGWMGPKQWLPIVGVLSVAIIGLAVALILNLDDADGAAGTPNTSAGRSPTHMHANFAVFINGQQFDFDKPEFMIAEDETPKSENVHLHVPRSDVVHVHTTLTTWDEFFTSIGFTLTDPSFAGITADRTCLQMPDGTKLCSGQNGNTWKFIANGVPVDGLSDVNIGDLDRVLFSYGPETVDEVLAKQWPKVNDTACIVSELCLDRVDPNEPQENCGGKGTCSK